MPRDSDIQVVVLRCGRTEWDDAERLQGRTDLPLSESGQQAVAAEILDLAQSRGANPFAAIYCSPDEASIKTAEMLGEAAGGKVRPDDELAGVDLGVWEGLLESQLMERFPKAYRPWKEDPASVIPPGGESLQEADMRLRQALCRLLEKTNGKPVALVLRPINFALACVWLGSKGTEDIWRLLDDGPHVQRLAVPRTLLRTTREELKAGA